MEKGKFTFDVKTGMKNIIGRDLITDDFIAIFELVKNAYDAYASYVEITFGIDEIIIADNGKGMTKADLNDKWFAVAYSAKNNGSEDSFTERETSYLNNLKYRRFYAGAKGVGRFSCDRLGNSLALITSKYDDGQAFRVDIDWSDFEQDERQSFDTVEVDYIEVVKTYIFPQKKNHGTILHIKNINSQWSVMKLLALKRSLEKLINPFKENLDFQIEIIAPLYESYDREQKKIGSGSQIINGLVKNTILEILNLKTTYIDVVIKNKIISTKIIDRENLIYSIEEPNIYNSIIDDLSINLYFLNRSAKNNFGRLMNLEPVNYGNVFLFKNGFRVEPYGNVGDDSWKIDKRKQQGYNRFLGTRDLFGKVELITTNNSEFKEVSSRNGGLVESEGKNMLFSVFYDKALKRLERYVAGVLWGEGFKRKNYFLDRNIADEMRNQLIRDKDKDNYEDIISNIGSKVDFVNLIKALSDDTDIKILYCNKELLDLVNDRLDAVQPKILDELEKIVINSNNQDLINQIKLAEDQLHDLIDEKEKALKREEDERIKRFAAEKKAFDEEKRRIFAETKQKQAELQARKVEAERLKFELEKIAAERKAIEELQKNKDLEDKLSIESKKNQYLNATRKTLSDDAEQLVHSIDLYVGNASTYVNDILASTSLNSEIKDKIYYIKNNIDKALKVSEIIIKSNFDYKHVNQRVNISVYIKEYLEDIALSRRDLKVNIGNTIDKFGLINPIDIDIVLDNLVSNSVKAFAKEILVEFELVSNKIVIYYYDDGVGLSEKLQKNTESIFELGVRDSNSKGSGIGMYDVKKRITNAKGSIIFLGNNLKLKGAGFKIQL